jgi:signal transduction histidine kinase
MSSGLRAPVISTLRARLTLWSLAMLAFSLILFAVLLYVSLSQTLYRHHDDELLQEAARLAERLARVASDGDVGAELQGAQDGPRFVMIRDAGGRLLYRSASLNRLDPTMGAHEAFVHATERTGGTPEFFTADLPSGPTRFICQHVAPGDPRFLQVGIVLGDLRQTLDRVRTLSLTLIPLVLIVSSFGGLVIARRALRPMERIDATLQAIQATDLSRRIDVHTTDQELQQLVRTLNGLLERLERAFASTREFAGDVSHQLQTPLTVMKGAIEIALGAESREPSKRAEVLRVLAGDVDDMIAVVRDLQTLSLADLPAPRSGDVPVDLSHMCRTVVEALSALGEAKQVQVEDDIAPDLRVWGDEIRLKQVLLNLGDNAIKFTPPGGTVRVSLSLVDRWIVLGVRDTGPGIAIEDVPKIFRRFYRASQPAGAPPGTGLGLAIARRIVEAHGGTIGLESEHGDGSTFTVRLPAAVPPVQIRRG